MGKLLYLQGSPRVDRSASRAVAQAFIDRYRTRHGDTEVDALDLFAEDLPAFDGLTVQAKYTILHGKQHTAEERAAWDAVERVIERFKSADVYVLAAPMWNFGIPYRVKHYIDIITQPGYTFSFSAEEGYKGLVVGRPVVIVSARGGAYAEGTASASMDFVSPYLKLAFGFMGFTDISIIPVEPTLAGGPEEADERKAAAVERARRMADEM